jgi:hypothetical protein
MNHLLGSPHIAKSEIMVQLVVGAAFLVASIGGLWVSLPVGGQMRSFARDGFDTWIAIAVTTGVGLGIGFLIAGGTALSGS